MKKHHSHGEVNFFEIDSVPERCHKVLPIEGGYKIADSETTGNFHMVKEASSIELLELGGILYMKNDEPAEVYCVDESRHDTIKIEPGIWEIEPSQEYDYLLEEKRNVAD